MKLLEDIQNYTPYNEQEKRDKEILIEALKSQSDIFSRDNKIAHMTASAWVVNRRHDKVLMIYHNIYNSWAWMGGHADGETDLLKVALKEVKEESGIEHVEPVTTEIYSVEVLTVDGHIKKGKYVSSHLHLNVTYLLEASEEDLLIIKEDENSNVAWFGLEEAIAVSTEPWFQERIYTKLNQKLKERVKL